MKMFQELFGDSPRVKIIEFFLNNKNSWSIIELSKKTKTGYSTLKILLPELERKKIVKIKKKIGKCKLYELNIKNPMISGLRKIK